MTKKVRFPKYDKRDECGCSCHEPGRSIIHCMPCCGECPVCHKNISTANWLAHKTRHFKN